MKSLVFLFYRPYEDQDNCPSEVLSKYRRCKNLIDRMKSTDTSKRPLCDDILKEIKLWDCDEQENSVTSNDAKPLISSSRCDSHIEFKTEKRIFIFKFLCLIVSIIILFILSYAIFSWSLPNENCSSRTKLSSNDYIKEILICNNNYEMNFIELLKLREGIMGNIYKVSDKNSGKYYAIEKISVESARILRRPLKIPRIPDEFFVKYFSVWLEENEFNNGYTQNWGNKFTLYIQMELCDQTLEEVTREMNGYLNIIKNGYLINYFTKVFILIEVAKSISNLWKNNITNSYIVPSNVLFKIESGGLQLKMSDFGFSKFFDFNNRYEDKGICKQVKHSPIDLTYDKKLDIQSFIELVEYLLGGNFFE
jgi:serine/threonine protein kinase